MIKKLAKITKAHLEIKERGILNFWIHVDYEEGCSQGVGGIALDTWCEESHSRVGTAYGCEMIRQLLLTLNVNDFAEMKGKVIYVLGDDSDQGWTPKGIETLRTDAHGKKSLVFDDVYQQFLEEK